MDFLTEEQRARFAEINARIGLGPMEFTTVDTFAKMDHSQVPDLMKMSSTGESHFTPHKMSVASIEDMRKILVTPNIQNPSQGEEPPVPPAPEPSVINKLMSVDPSVLKAQIPSDMKKDMSEAAIAYALGNATDEQDVQDWVSIINQHMYPGTLTAYSMETLTVPPGKKLVLSGDEPLFINIGKIVLGAGSELIINTQFSVNSQQCQSA
ncbi:hypothetical protein [Ferrimonas aestuarii]|uniref:Uncharacterized protein n=1 Tax=Ferrimonas aestuarii TaxID=2569539 RepID=A0A4U1BMG6_9GAMM|nr:hypothetical protein [Ferrimonas aestuarii]TKB52741.1 hypothetical protein FCL42_15645 [Ferrimonas aestuarii]